MCFFWRGLPHSVRRASKVGVLKTIAAPTAMVGPLFKRRSVGCAILSNAA